MKEKLRLLGSLDCRVRILFAAGFFMTISVFLPFFSYTYRNGKYDLVGSGLVTGKAVCGGATILTPNICMIVMLIAGGLIMAAALFEGLLKARKSTWIILTASLAGVVCNIYLSSRGEDLLEHAKDVRVGAGSILALAAGVISVAASIYLLWKLKAVSALDFMALPCLLYFIINNYIPMFGIVLAFKKIDYRVGIFRSPWNGLNNFKQLFSASTGSFFDSDAYIITRNTILYNAAFIILGIIVGVLVGICMSELYSRFLQKFFQTSILLPQLISYVIVAYIVYAFLSNDAGMVNKLLGENAVNFYAKTKYWPFILTFIYIWKQVGYNAIIFLSSIVGIDRSYYEAAKVDGCGRLKLIRYITLPLLKPTIMTLFMLNVGRIMYSDFGLFYQVPLNSGALYNVTSTIDTYVYRCLMTLNDIGVSSAACTYQAVIGFVLVFIVNMLIRRKDKENALF